MSKSKFVHVKRIAVFSLILGSIAAAALAAPVTTNANGAYCVAASGALTVRSDGEIENATAASATAVCPVERPISPSATKISGRVFVLDRHPTQNLCCRVMSKNPSGAIVSSPQVCATNDNTTSFQILDLQEITDLTTFSQFFIQCTLPPTPSPLGALLHSRIQLYRTTQE